MGTATTQEKSSLPFNNSGNCCLARIICLCKGTIAFTLRMTITYLLALHVCQLRIGTQLSPKIGLWSAHSPFANSVLHVLRTGTNTQVSRINTGRVITGVQNMSIFRNITIQQSPYKAMCKAIPTSKPHLSIAIPVNSTLPNPATVRIRAINMCPELINNIASIPFFTTMRTAQWFKFLSVNRNSSNEDSPTLKADAINFLKTISRVVLVSLPTAFLVHICQILRTGTRNKVLRIYAIAYIAGMTNIFFVQIAIFHVIGNAVSKVRLPAQGQGAIPINHTCAGPEPAGRITFLDFCPKSLSLYFSERVSCQIVWLSFHEFYYTTFGTGCQ